MKLTDQAEFESLKYRDDIPAEHILVIICGEASVTRPNIQVHTEDTCAQAKPRQVRLTNCESMFPELWSKSYEDSHLTWLLPLMHALTSGISPGLKLRISKQPAFPLIVSVTSKKL